jgi:hypothetical protein
MVLHTLTAVEASGVGGKRKNIGFWISCFVELQVHAAFMPLLSKWCRRNCNRTARQLRRFATGGGEHGRLLGISTSSLSSSFLGNLRAFIRSERGQELIIDI